jgi:hypothetical protein
MGNRPHVDFDRLGSIASLLCAVHCALTGFALGLVSTVGLSFLASEGAETIFIVVTLTLGALAIWSGYRKHRKPWPASLFLLGAFLIGFSHSMFGHGHETHPVSRVVSILGAASLIGFHYVNQRLAKLAGTPQSFG